MDAGATDTRSKLTRSVLAAVQARITELEAAQKVDLHVHVTDAHAA